MKFNRNRRRSKKIWCCINREKKEAENREKLPKSQCKYSVVIRISKLREKTWHRKKHCRTRKKGAFNKQSKQKKQVFSNPTTVRSKKRKEAKSAADL